MTRERHTTILEEKCGGMRTSGYGTIVVIDKERTQQPMANDGSQKEALYGPRGQGDYKEGDSILFRDVLDGGKEKLGSVLFVRAPGPAIQGGKIHPLLYMVYVDGEGFPKAVYARDVIEQQQEYPEYGQNQNS